MAHSAAGPQSSVNAGYMQRYDPCVNGRSGVVAVKRLVVGFIAVMSFVLGPAIPMYAALEIPVRIDCSDGDRIDLSVDTDTLTALTSSVEAINASDTDLTCSLVQLAAPSLVFNSASTALAASGGYVIGAGTIDAGCPPDFATSFVASFSVKIYTKDGTLRGSANLSTPSGSCVGASKLYSKPGCLAVSPTTLGGGRAWANSFVTSTSGAFFASQAGKTVGWAFEDNGPNGGTVIKDRWRVVERPGSCPAFGDPSPIDFYTLKTGDVSVRP